MTLSRHSRCPCYPLLTSRPLHPHSPRRHGARRGERSHGASATAAVVVVVVVVVVAGGNSVVVAVLAVLVVVLVLDANRR